MARAQRSTSERRAATLALRVTPGARHDRLSIDADGTLRVAVRARAAENQANRAVVHALAEWLGVPPSTVTIWRGAASRQKVVRIEGLDERALAARLSALRASPEAPSAPSRGAPGAE